MQFNYSILKDRVEIVAYGEKKELARIEIYHWNIMKEYGLEITDLLRVAFGNNA
jgi:hypothetical protein